MTEQKNIKKKSKSRQALCAMAIRKELKTTFPHIKFSVRSESFSMGDSVNIHWTDGPTSKQVSNITDKYQYGHFNGMEDMYENSNTRDDIPQSKFVHTQRTMSEDVKQAIIKKHNETFCESGQIKDLNAWNEDAQCFNQDVVYRTFSETSIQESQDAQELHDAFGVTE